MKADVFSLEGKKLRSIDLPKQFNENYEPDIVRRAVLVIQNNNRQAYGAMLMAGMNYSSKLSRRRRNYKGAYGKAISRVPRKTMWRRGMQFGWVGATAPGTVGGRKSHPPKSFKKWNLKINNKERRKAIRSALGGVAVKAKLIVLETKAENLKHTKEVGKLLKALNFEVSAVKRKRAGRGKSRGRRIRYKKNPLFVVSSNCGLVSAISNLPGYDVVDVKSINAAVLSLGFGKPRNCIFTEKALDILDREGLFFNKQ